jgi:hypothetical protein
LEDKLDVEGDGRRLIVPTKMIMKLINGEEG